jgi:hypothetical protein
MPVRRKGGDDEDETPKKKRRPVADDDDDEEDETPKKKRRPVDDDDEEETPKRKRKSADDDDDEEESSSRKVKKSGWAALAQKREQIETEKEQRENQIQEFYLTKENDTAPIQFLQSEPTVVDGHQIKTQNGRFIFTPCQLNTQKSCLMCQDRIKLTAKFAFKVLDFRGEYDKTKKRFKFNKKTEKLYYMGMKMAEQVKKFADGKNKELNEMVIEITRSGDGKATSYNFGYAFDKDEKRLRPVEWEETFPSIKKLTKPMDDDALEALGFSAANED